MRIIAGEWRGRALTAPAGELTRPTSERMRQAIFDMLMHAPWGGRSLIEGAVVLDAFAGTGAMGLEALSRGAASVTFIERNRAAVAALRANIAACRADDRCRVIPGDATRPPTATMASGLVFLDPPYAQGLVETAVAALTTAGWMRGSAVVVAESERGEAPVFDGDLLAERTHGAARVTVWQTP